MRLTLEKNEQERIPLILLAGWALFIIISIFVTPLSILLKGTVIISLLARLALIFSLWILFRRIYGAEIISKEKYEGMLLYIGYAIVFTYVFSMLPQVVSDFYLLSLWKGSGFYTILIILTTLWPAALWSWLSLDRCRVSLGAYTPKEIKKRQEAKKDKAKKKARQKLKHHERSLWGNVWAEWIEPLFGAVLWVLVINHFILQLYQIPSESMVPTFLIKDRVLVGKSFYAPNIPLTRYKLPRIVKPKEGEVIIFTNPKVEDPESELYYNSVFTRVFQTFVYMISFTTVDIDSKADGTPKARMLVKRNIAGPGEKLCLVNDQVYKRRENGEWTAMADIAGQQEYGRVELFSYQNPKLRTQRETPETRQLVEEAIKLVQNGGDFSSLENQLKLEKEHFLELVQKTDFQEIKDWDLQITEKMVRYEKKSGPIDNFFDSMRYTMNINNALIPPEQKPLIQRNFEAGLTMYSDYMLSGEIQNLLLFLSKENSTPGYLEREIDTDIQQDSQANPYESFMVRLNALYKLRRLQFYNYFLEEGWNSLPLLLTKESSKELYRLLFYTHGAGYLRPFESSNLPEYPAEDGEYLGDDEYFLMGDNRFNSLDSRMGDSFYPVYVDQGDLSDFALQAEVSWEPHSIPLRLIHGKVRLILFPMDRLRFFR